MAASTEEVKNVLLSAGVGRAYWRTTLTQNGDAGIRIRKYLMDGEYAKDKLDSVGVCLVGPGVTRTKLLNVMAKEMALLMDGVLVTTLVDIMSLVGTRGSVDEDKYRDHSRSKALVINNFHCAGNPPFFNEKERFLVENYLQKRLSNGRRIYIASDVRIRSMHWWSDDMRSILEMGVKELV
jgi:hypothetical protein